MSKVYNIDGTPYDMNDKILNSNLGKRKLHTTHYPQVILSNMKGLVQKQHPPVININSKSKLTPTYVTGNGIRTKKRGRSRRTIGRRRKQINRRSKKR